MGTVWGSDLGDIGGERGHPASNVNYGPEVIAGEEDFFGASVLEENEEILAHQHRFVDKTLSITLQYGNVLYNINNEGSQPRAWDNYWAFYVALVEVVEMQ